MPFGKSPEEKAAEQAARAQAEAARQQQAAQAAYAASPVGRAQTARQNGDAFFQLELDISSLSGTSGFGSSRAGEQRGPGRPDVLGQIEDVGWRLEHVGYVFIETGSTSTDRMFATGEGTVTRGVVRGIYLFRAAPA